jgi:hypothetical protein
LAGTSDETDFSQLASMIQVRSARRIFLTLGLRTSAVAGAVFRRAGDFAFLMQSAKSSLRQVDESYQKGQSEWVSEFCLSPTGVRARNRVVLATIVGRGS